MKHLLLYLACLFILSCNQHSETEKIELPLLSQPVTIEDDDWTFEGTENLILVPENRNGSNSRTIPLHFFKFPAKEKSNLPPVVFLGAGPGEPYNVKAFYNGKRAEAWRYELNFVNQKRDVILINQRGNSSAPGLSISNFRYKWKNGGTLNKPFDAALADNNRKEGYAKAIKEYTSKGIDLRGYDIIHFIDDIEAIRKALNYNKIALIGNSFATQWALGYIQRYPEYVDRALFSGVEPLSHNYDDPDAKWTVLKQIDAYAKADAEIAKSLPKGGVIEAFKTIITRLENQPQTVHLKAKATDEEDITMVVGADDLRLHIINPKSRSYVGDIESWPKYITEMYHGDFRVLAEHSIGRIYNSSSLIINPLVNNSLDFSKQRDSIISSRASVKWLGDTNSDFRATRSICPAPKVSDTFRQHIKHNIPVILIQGDMDLSTPYPNATYLMNYLENGHLITVKRGFHNAKRALIFDNREVMNTIYEFMNVDFNVTDFQTFKKTLPITYELPEFNFQSIKGKPLYDTD